MPPVGGFGAPTMMPGPGPMTPPPAATPPAASLGSGVQSQVHVELSNVVKGLIRILGLLKGVASEEARASLAALKALEKVTPEVDEGVSLSEVKALMSNAQTTTPGPGARPGGGLGPPMPQPRSVAGMPFGMNLGVSGPGG